MPEQSRQKIRFANLSTSFVQMAKLGSESEQLEAIARRHIKEMRMEFAQLNKVQKKKQSSKTNITSTQRQQPAETDHPSAQTGAHNPLRQNIATNVSWQRASPNVQQQTADCTALQ
jgi:hypothetical protein